MTSSHPSEFNGIGSTPSYVFRDDLEKTLDEEYERMEDLRVEKEAQESSMGVININDILSDISQALPRPSERYRQTT